MIVLYVKSGIDSSFHLYKCYLVILVLEWIDIFHFGGHMLNFLNGPFTPKIICSRPSDRTVWRLVEAMGAEPNSYSPNGRHLSDPTSKFRETSSGMWGTGRIYLEVSWCSTRGGSQETYITFYISSQEFCWCSTRSETSGNVNQIYASVKCKEGGHKPFPNFFFKIDCVKNWGT